jgi:hypothetical protein
MYSARHVIGCQLTQESRIRRVFDDVDSSIHESLVFGNLRRRAHRSQDERWAMVGRCSLNR